MVSIFITDMFIREEVNPEKRHHQAYTPMGEKKPGVVYKRKYRKAEERICEGTSVCFLTSLSSTTLPLSICIPHPHLCTMSKDHTGS
jgi:hypothetical protein